MTEGNELDVLGETCEVFETPGHDPSCLCFRIAQALFTGDAYIPGVKVFTGFPYSDKKLAAESLQRIISLISRITVFPGHELHQT